MGKLKDQALSGYNVDAVLEATGGEMKGKSFRVAKRAANKQNRINKRAKRKAHRRGEKLREGYEGYINDKETRKVGKYFKNLKTARGNRAGTTAAIVAGTVMTAGAGLAAAGAIGGGAAVAGAGGAAVAGGTAATGLAAGTGASIGLGAGGASVATTAAGAGTAIGSAAAGTTGLAGLSTGTIAAGTTATASTAGSFIPNALKTANQVGEIAGNVQKVSGAAQSVKTLLTPQQQQQQQQPEPQTTQGLGFNTYASQNSPSSNTGAYMVNPNSSAYANNVYIPPNLA